MNNDETNANNILMSYSRWTEKKIPKCIKRQFDILTLRKLSETYEESGMRKVRERGTKSERIHTKKERKYNK